MKVQNALSGRRIASRCLNACIGIAVALLSAEAHPALGQYMFLDCNGDGRSTEADVVSTTDPTTLRLWIVTDADANGSPSTLDRAFNAPLTINSYEVILSAENGQVEWGAFKNLQGAMTYLLGEKHDSSELYAAYGGTKVLAPGTYLLGEVDVRTASGTPQIDIVPRSHLAPYFGTAFGSKCPGRDGDNTLKLGDAEAGGNGGDWRSTSGALSSSDPNRVASKEGEPAGPPRAFAVRVHRTSLSNGVLSVTTTRGGALRVRLYDIHGRLVRTLMDAAAIGPGVYDLPIKAPGMRATSGVYFYKVEASERTVAGKVVMVR